MKYGKGNYVWCDFRTTGVVRITALYVSRQLMEMLSDLLALGLQSHKKLYHHKSFIFYIAVGIRKERIRLDIVRGVAYTAGVGI